MKNILILLTFFLSSLGIMNAQDFDSNPIDYLKGDWMIKLTNIEPTPADDTWNTITRVMSFESIHNGNGLKQISYIGLENEETFHFFDSNAKILYGMKVDGNGYVWQTEMSISDDGKFEDSVSIPLHDKSKKMVNKLTRVHENEMRFEYSAYSEGELLAKASGVLYRIPSDFKE